MDDESPGGRSIPIGNLMTEIANTLTEKGTATNGSPNRQSDSATTMPARIPGSRIGMRRGEPGSITLPSLREAAARVIDPAETDRALLASLPPSVASALRPTYRERIDPVYGFDSEFTGYAIVPADIPAADLMRSVQAVAPYMAPPDENLIKRELARLRVSTKARAESDDDLAMGFQVLAEECAEYPADVVVWALRNWARTEIFYPSLAEIRDRLQRGARRRAALIDALDRERERKRTRVA